MIRNKIKETNNKKQSIKKITIKKIITKLNIKNK